MTGGDSVQQVKDKLSIIDVISPYVELHKAGKSYKGKSPFTSEKTPSFHVSPDRGMYYCFSSSQGGDMFTFIEKMEGVDFKGALKILAEKAGVELVPEDPKKRDARDTQYALIEEATKFFFDTRETQDGIKKYVKDRGVDGKTVHIWRIGYAQDDWRTLRAHLAAKKFTDEQMLNAGLIKKADGGKEPYDVFRDRVMFPFKDSSGRVVAFSGRTMKKDDKTPKYVNSPETELFQKSEILYGYDKAKEGIRKFDFSLIVEGQFDVVLAHQAGYMNTVAVSGTALTLHHVGLLARLSNKVVLALDADRAGIAAMKKGASIMLRKGMDVKVARIPEGKDPADIVRDEGKEALKHVIGQASHVVEFLLSIFKESSIDDRAYKLQVREEIVPLLAIMPNRIDREHFEKVIAETIETTTDAIHYEVERLAQSSETTNRNENQVGIQENVSTSTQRTGVSRKTSLLEYFAGLEVLQNEKIRTIATASYKEIISTIGKGICEDTIDSSKLSRVMFELERQIESQTKKELKTDIVDKLNELISVLVKEQMIQHRIKIAEKEAQGDFAGIDLTLKEINDLQKRLNQAIFEVEIFD